MPQNRGIRQECPLSPCLFLVVLLMLWSGDLEQAEPRQGIVDWGELLHANGIAVVTDSAATASMLLRIVELSTVHDGLRLNRSKCEAIVLGEDGAIMRFEDGTGLAHPESGEVPRLLHVRDGVHGADLGRRLGGAARPWQKLGLFGKSEACAPRWRLLIHDAVIRTKLVCRRRCRRWTRFRYGAIIIF